MNSTTPRKVINDDQSVPHSLQKGDSVSVTFGSKCGPLQSSLVIFSVSLDLSSRDFFYCTDSVIIKASMLFFLSFYLSYLFTNYNEKRREREKRRGFEDTTKLWLWKHQYHKKILTRQNQWPIMIKVGYTCR